MLVFLLFFSRFLVDVQLQPMQARSLKVETCKNQEKYKFIVSVQRNGKHECNGVMLTKKIIFTTGACIKEKLECSPAGNNPHVTVMVVYEPLKKFPNGENCEVVEVDRCITHWQYEKAPYHIYHNAGVIILKRSMMHYTKTPFTEEKYLLNDYSNYCKDGTVVGFWGHLKTEKPKAELECFKVTIKPLFKCFEMDEFVWMRGPKNFTSTCSFDKSNRFEVCTGFYGAPLICSNRVVGLVSHKFNFSEQCTQVSPFYYHRIDRSPNFRDKFTNNIFSLSGSELDESVQGRSTKIEKKPSSSSVVLEVSNFVIYSLMLSIGISWSGAVNL